MNETEQGDDTNDDDEVPVLCRRCGDPLLDLVENDDGLQGWCDACQEWGEPSAEPDEWDTERELEYDLSDLDHPRRQRLIALLDQEGTPFVWDPDYRLVVCSDDEEDVDGALDTVGANPDVAFATGDARTGGPLDDDDGDEDDDDDEEDDDEEDDDDDEEDDDGDDLDGDGQLADWERTPLDDDAAEEIADALEDLAVVVRQLRRDGRADIDRATVTTAYSLVAGSAAPYGYSEQHWAELIGATAALARVLANGSPSDRQVAAARLQRVLPGA